MKNLLSAVFWLALSLVVGSACGDADLQGSTSSPLGDLPEAGLVVVCSDYASTSISILDSATLEVTHPAHLHSGSIPPGGGPALGGDVTLPTTFADGEILVLDRYPAGVITWLGSPQPGRPSQLNVGADFAPNPHDALRLADGRWLVTRYGASPALEEAEPQGDDILVLSHERAPLQTVGLGHLVDGRVRPDRLLPVDATVWVSLNRVEGDFETWHEGAIAVLENTADTDLVATRAFPVEGVTNCGLMSAHGEHVVVACGGSYQGGAPSLADGGLVLLGTMGEETARLLASDPRVEGAFGADLTWDQSGDVLAIVYGDLEGRADRVIRWHVHDDAVEVVYTASGPFRTGGLAAGPTGSTLVLDADPAGGLLCELHGQGCLNPCPLTHLPPRALRFFGSSGNVGR